MTPRSSCRIMSDATDDLVAWARRVRDEAASPWEAAQRLVARLGAHPRDGHAEVGFWLPDLAAEADTVVLDVWTALEPIDFAANLQAVSFRREHVPLVRDGEFWWGVIEGLQVGSREQVGSFYWARYQDAAGTWHAVVDPLAASIPFGAFAPAELYDVAGMLAARDDVAHFTSLETLDAVPEADGVPRVQAPTNILQLHVGTASEAGTLAGLTRLYERLAHKRQRGEPLTPAEMTYIGYDAIQLMPIEPIIEYEAGPRFWRPDTDDPEAETVTVTLRRPDMTNWGYDVVISASPAINPVLLETGRPDELLDLIETLHHFPDGPIKVVLDIVYGHADNQALALLPSPFFAGANMYGQNLAYNHPIVRAMLLEMQRRKSDYGVDGLRVDGAQDFKVWNPETLEMEYDDEYLHEMNDLVQEVAGQRYRPWMVFEDGRPWPRDDWELASSYREVTKLMPNVVQWGPLTFAHNTPFLFTFWANKWWRIKEIAQLGSDWITGCANHDTVRRGTQVDPAARVNTRLGETLPEILDKAYDNPVAKLFDYAFMPGIPMDFINASIHAPWSFVRNTDDRYGVKVVSEEARFLHWQVDPHRFEMEHAFPRLKALGFTSLHELRRFLHALDHAVQLTDYDLEEMVAVLEAVRPPLAGPPLSVKSLKQIARAWMDDLPKYCNVAAYADELDPTSPRFNLLVREFRRARPWLMQNLRPTDHFNRLQPMDGTVVFYGWRTAPDDGEQVLFVANMEGAPRTLTPIELPIPNLPTEGWALALAAPGLDEPAADAPLTLHDSQGAVWVRRAEADA